MSEDVGARIVGVARRLRYPLSHTHKSFEAAANVVRNRVIELQRELAIHEDALRILDEGRLALFAEVHANESNTVVE